MFMLADRTIKTLFLAFFHFGYCGVRYAEQAYYCSFIVIYAGFITSLGVTEYMNDKLF